ncbi:hypothetical protein [Oceanicoccus sagamiensis]|uniref:Uncharacterized protein n=1 Tax=Oceanicoccus sagamiensis TaxID=716816 RepID=A0A1X9ND58_9GAMM|nr:hypothetical protein [Oceanicoccus sagamiensis]ARN74332.1 hypothetical protein BST96_09470 [Oceanicoccus sagamiensis]
MKTQENMKKEDNNTFYYDDVNEVKIVELLNLHQEIDIFLERKQAILMDYLLLQIKYDVSIWNPLKIFCMLYQILLSIINFEKVVSLSFGYEGLHKIRRVCQWKDVNIDKRQTDQYEIFCIREAVKK